MLLTAIFPISASADLVVTNVLGEQRPGTDLVDVYYDLDAANSSSVSVRLQVSDDSGSNWSVPVVNVSQDVGPNVPSGHGKHILWNAGADWNGKVSKNVRFKVIASDAASLRSGLVAYYPFDGDANDASGNGNDGIIHGGVTFVPGRTGFAAQFNGANGFVSVANCPALDLTSTFTLSAWIYQSATQGDGYRIVDKCPAGTASGWTFDTYGNHGNGHQLRFQTVGPSVLGSTDYSLSVWHHVVATVSDTTVKVYVDGLQDGEGIVGQIPSNSLDIFIGAPHAYGPWGVREYFNGLIDDVRIYNRALSAAEVEQLYNYSEPL